MNTLTCAIEFGTSRISAIVAMRDDEGHVTVRAIEHEPSNGCVRHGYIYNVEESAAKTKSLIQKLVNRLSSEAPIAIGKVYVGLAGMSIHTMPHTATLHVGGEAVTEETLQALRRQSEKVPLQGYDLYDVEAMYYHVDGRLVQNPLGAKATEVTAFNQLIIGRSFIKQNARAVIERAGLEIAAFVTLPLSTGDILTDIEKQQGCVLVNFGAGTTTVAIYKNTLRHLAVIPLGGEVITLDIMSAGMRRNEAETAKELWSSAYVSSAGDVRISTFQEANIGMEIKQLNRIVQYRYEEIIANIRHQIEISGIADDINGGCIITGGASAQKNIITLISQQLHMGVKVRTYQDITGNGEEKRTRYASLLSMAAQATIDCRTNLPAAADTPPSTPAAPADDDPTDEGVKPIIGKPKKGEGKNAKAGWKNLFPKIKENLLGFEGF